jgi:hypothetical protein
VNDYSYGAWDSRSDNLERAVGCGCGTRPKGNKRLKVRKYRIHANNINRNARRYEHSLMKACIVTDAVKVGMVCSDLVKTKKCNKYDR